MDSIFRNQLFEQAKEWIFIAGNRIRESMQGPLHIETKSNANDLVTIVDKQTEDFFAAAIRGKYPDHGIMGEEGYGDDLANLEGTVWIIDPIDGTMNFVHQKRNFCISVGIYHDGVGEIGFVYDVMADVLYSAKRGEGAYKNGQLLPKLSEVPLKRAILGMNHYWLCKNRVANEQVMQDLAKTVRGLRNYGSAALEFAYVAEGLLDGYIALHLAPWDIAAGIVIVNETGGKTTDITGEPLDLLQKQPILTCNPSLQYDLLSWLDKGRE